MVNSTKEWPIELSHFQVEELEERLENKWDSTPQNHTNECGGEALYCSCPINGGTEDTIERIY